MNVIKNRSSLLNCIAKQQSTLVLAGHYCVAEDMSMLNHTGLEEAHSFCAGVELVATALKKSQQSHLLLWINDIGVPPDQRKQIKQNYILPRNYRQALHDHQLDRKHLTIRFESTMRNKASVALRKIVKRNPSLFRKVAADTQGLVRCVANEYCEMEAGKERYAYVIDGPHGDPLVVKEGSNPKCNLILATLFEELTKQHSPKLIVNIFNELYSYRIALGSFVCRAIYENHVPMMNLFFDGEQMVCPEPTNESILIAVGS